jgi:large subunit ribosomal protein L29
MKAEKYRELTRQELERIVRDLKEELFNLRFRVSTQKLDNPLRLRLVRRDLARILTVLREDELGRIRLPGSAGVGSGETAQSQTQKEAVENDGDTKEN